jgi:hypothetical protein
MRTSARHTAWPIPTEPALARPNLDELYRRFPEIAVTATARGALLLDPALREDGVLFSDEDYRHGLARQRSSESHSNRKELRLRVGCI